MSGQRIASPVIAAEQRPDGTLCISAKEPLAAHSASILHSFHDGCTSHPDRLLVAEKVDGAWSTCTWAEARQRVDRIAQGLHDREIAGRPVLIISHNSIANLLVTLAAYTIASPVVPSSVAYALQSPDFTKLRHIVEVCDPGAVFAEDPSYSGALQAIGAGRLLLSAGHDTAGTTSLDSIAVNPSAELADSVAAIGAETIAKIMFTSGSTGPPKGVINTHGMLAANQQQIRQVWPFVSKEAPVLLDWLPWSHTFGGNHNVNMILVNGGSLWIDCGRPSPSMIGHTVANLADVQPTVYFNVPAGYGALLPILTADPVTAKRFFSALRVAFFAGAALPQRLWDSLAALADQYGSDVHLATAWGMTETAPASTVTPLAVARSDSIGVPLPGVELKLVPAGDRYELRIRGPNVTPGYYGRSDSRDDGCFDSDGFLCTGDVVSLINTQNPSEGLAFAGRLAENFKLATGTFVAVDSLRTKLLSVYAGLLQDAILCGEGGDSVSALVWLHPDQADRLGPDGCPDENLRADLVEGMRRLAATGGGPSERIERLLILTTPPDIDAGEITDKGYINQRIARERRADLVAEVTAATPTTRTVCRVAAVSDVLC